LAPERVYALYADFFGDGFGTFFVLCLGVVGYTFVALAAHAHRRHFMQNTFMLLWYFKRMAVLLLEHLQQLGISTCYPTKFAKSIKILLQQLLISTY